MAQISFCYSASNFKILMIGSRFANFAVYKIGFSIKLTWVKKKEEKKHNSHLAFVTKILFSDFEVVNNDVDQVQVDKGEI